MSSYVAVRSRPVDLNQTRALSDTAPRGRMKTQSDEEAEIDAMYIDERRRRVREEEHTGRHAVTHATVTALLAGGFAGTVDTLQGELQRPLGLVPRSLIRTVLRELVRAGAAERSYRGRVVVWHAPVRGDVVLHTLKPPRQLTAIRQGMRIQYQRQVRSIVLKRDGHRCRFCGATDDLYAAHLVPVDTLRHDVDLRTAHQPFLMVTLCGEHHKIYDGSLSTPMQAVLIHEQERRTAAYDEERRLLRESAPTTELDRIARTIQRHEGTIARLRHAADSKRARIRGKILAGLDLSRERAALGLTDPEDFHLYGVEEILIELAIRTMVLTNDFVATRPGHEADWNHAGWSWNRGLRAWVAATGTGPPSTVPRDRYNPLEKGPYFLSERRRIVLAERLLIKWEKFCGEWRQHTLLALRALSNGPIFGASLSKVCPNEANWIRTILVPLDLCLKRQEGTRVVYDLTGHGFVLLAKEGTPTPQECLLFAVQDSIDPIVNAITKDLSPGSGSHRDLDEHADVIIRRRTAQILAHLLTRAFPWITVEAARGVLYARGLWQP